MNKINEKVEDFSSRYSLPFNNRKFFIKHLFPISFLWILPGIKGYWRYDCRPCYLKFKIPACETRRCLNKITPQEVLGAVDKLLELN